MSDVLEVLGNLIQHWRNQGLSPCSGYRQETIAQAQKRLGVMFPEQFYDYLLISGGFGCNGSVDQDADGFRFWSLERLSTVDQEYASKVPPEPPPRGGDRLLIFADYLDWSWAFAINTETSGDDSGAVFAIGGDWPVKVASSLSEFWEIYVANSGRLFP